MAIKTIKTTKEADEDVELLPLATMTMTGSFSKGCLPKR